MRFFKSFGDSLNYKEILPLDGAFSRAHALYRGSPIFFGSDGETLVQDARKLALPPDVEGSSAVEYLHMFDGTESGYDRASRRIIWKAYWLEYIHAFDQLISVLSDSIVTVYVGRQAIELGFKYLLLEKTGQIEKTHDLGKLAHALISEGEIAASYMQWVDVFCEKYCSYIEGCNAEYFRFPEYKTNSFFAGNHLDIKWLCYCFALILLKLLHFARLDEDADR